LHNILLTAKPQKDREDAKEGCGDSLCAFAGFRVFAVLTPGFQITPN
jgi:hypothetical protein